MFVLWPTEEQLEQIHSQVPVAPRDNQPKGDPPMKFYPHSDGEHERMLTDIADEVRGRLKRNHNAVYLLILDIEAGLIPGLYIGTRHGQEKTDDQTLALAAEHGIVPYLSPNGTLDERILDALESKRSTAAELIDGEVGA
jgi:hypothetical protein